jgi:hypothetical protein
VRFSEGRISYLAHRIVEVLRQDGLVEIDNERLTLAEIKRLFSEEYEHDARIDAAVRKKIASLSRNVPPGSREWDVLYQTYAAEERRRQKS